jgi:hypothetical protein
MIKSFLLEIWPAYLETVLQDDIKAVFELIDSVPFCKTSTHGYPSLTTTGNPVAHRCGLLGERDHECDKPFLYPQYLKADDTCFTKEVGQDVSSFFVKRNLFISFFCPDEKQLSNLGRDVGTYKKKQLVQPL